MSPTDEEVLAKRTDLLRTLFAQDTSPAVALGRLAMFHGGTETCELREGFVAAGDRLFPPASAVRELLVLLTARLGRNFAESQREEDDLLNAAFAIYGLAAIHPFRNGNGRTSVDFAQYLMMKRWNVPSPPFELPLDAHRTLGPLFRSIERGTDGREEGGQAAALNEIVERLRGATLPWLRESKEFGLVAKWLGASCAPASSPSEPQPTERWL